MATSPIKKKRRSPTFTENQDFLWVSGWLRDTFVEDKEGFVSKNGMYHSYLICCRDYNIKAIKKNIFGKYIKILFPNSRPRRLGKMGNQHPVYSGFRYREKEDNLLVKWVKRNYILDANYQTISLDEIYDEYVSYCKMNGNIQKNKLELDKVITILFNTIEKKNIDDQILYFGISKVIKLLHHDPYISYLNTPIENYYRQNFES
jgi:hypothetical protein